MAAYLASAAGVREAVARWRVGEVVEFPQRTDAGVIVRAGGRVVARGELVDVDGCVGVALTEVLP